NKRARYSRPCDGCSLKKVKCSGTSPCTRCINNGIPCTNNRIRKKCGPKPNKFKSTNNSNSNSSSRQSSTSSQFSKKPKTNLYSQPQLCSSCDKEMRISLSLIVPSLQIYQTWFYGVWPVISVPQLISNLTSVDFGFELSQETSVSYALCLAVSAAVSRQMTFLSEKSSLPQVPVNIDFESVAKEAIRIRDLYDHRLNPNCETLLTSFFLYVYYINIKDATATAIIYLREAISMAQILKLHDAKTYMRKPVAEAHRLKKIFYLLLITERFMCIEDNVPVILDACVPYPSLEEEEYPELLSGFIELVHIFSIPNRDFFEKMLEFNDDGGSGNSSDNYKMLHSFLHDASHSMSESQIIEVDSKLRNISLTHLASDIQKANILLSKSWMRSLTWHIAQKRGVLKRNFNDNDSCLSFNYPATIANDFLKSICGIPIYAFESNGPGVVVKLLEIASGLADSIQDLSSIKSSDDLQPCYNALSSIFSLICKFKTDTILPVKLYQNIERMV
ncbi:putative sucrose utilization protein SUC1, partial [Scheffersomyces amazonensis]|uniref:putative sucrose utilization protein SUC1 n=1 Tax=Scheffersomyces amazonensis TaxID=1078765 RepID=UPI00315CBB3D